MMPKTEMGNYSLQDLVLVGVKWELSETPPPFRKENLELKTESLDNNKSQISKLSATEAAAAPVTPVVNASDALDAARAAAENANSFEELCAVIESCDHPLKSFAKTIRPQISNLKSQITIITDSPSGDDDDAGRILSGAAGDLLDKMLSAIGLSREIATIVPLVFWRPAGGRTPTREELDLCRPYVDRAIELSGPKVVLTLGVLAAAEIANAKLPAQHGEIFQLSECSVIPIFHPNYLLLKPDAKKPVWDILQKMQNLLQTCEK
ncbi:MAG: uracil-DNA glycosylase [Alphaproteobacteria bacterium]|nr:uracil-DNA glycosylase [Alphaproteobacteria bacterium]